MKRSWPTFVVKKGPNLTTVVTISAFPLRERRTSVRSHEARTYRLQPVVFQFESRIRPLLNHPLIEYIGEVDEQGKNELLGGAYALLFPIQWPEPFGMVMTESMACGTPVIAFEQGSVNEVMKDGVSGFIMQSVEEAIAATSKIPEVDRKACRRLFEERYTSTIMAQHYLQAYRKVLQNWPVRQPGMVVERAAAGVSIPAAGGSHLVAQTLPHLLDGK